MATSSCPEAPTVTVNLGRKADIDVRRRGALMRRFALAPFPPLNFLDCDHDPLPHRCTLHVATLQHSIGTLGGRQGGAVSGLVVDRSARVNGGLTQSTGCLLVDFLQDFVENLKRPAHLAHVALTMPVIVHRLALA